jgi:aspartate/glutamate racemase
VIINSLDVDKGIALLDAGRLGELADYLTTGVELLVRAGADFGFFAANTPHLVFDEVQRRSAIPLLSIVRVTCDYTKALGLKKVGPFENEVHYASELLPGGISAGRYRPGSTKGIRAGIHSREIHW